MARIDAVAATQVGDFTRPTQSVRDQEAQALEVRKSELSSKEPDAYGKDPTPDEVSASIKGIQKILETATNRQLNFAVNDRFKELVVRISDSKSGEVIKELPSKEFMKLRERLNDLIGMFIDEKA
jgi:flagellar protein FlaG